MHGFVPIMDRSYFYRQQKHELANMKSNLGFLRFQEFETLKA